jgi:hypothetical protein
MVITGAVVYSNKSNVMDSSEGFVLLIIGAIMLLPGSYGVISLYGAYKKWRGYTYDSMPLMD